ncbi:hypothetical protein HYV80_05585 [Candidatus Woesearchaeota archaeon]|nr:hypothetical protein [Candidatus Woesearchaeota archaeon]
MRRIILFLIFALFLAACDTSQSGSSGGFGNLGFGSSSKKTPEINVYVGTSGLTAEFAKTAPPPKVFEDSSFPILMRIKNIGAFNIGENDLGVISIGRERDYIPQLTVEDSNKIFPDSTNDNLLSFIIEGKTQLNPQGDELIIPISARTGKLDPQSENKQSTLTATLCYPYKTALSTTVCIDPDIGNLRPGKKACTVKEMAFGNGQGAPISIVKIEPQMIPEVGTSPGSKSDVIKPQFLIFVENKGRGTPVDGNYYISSCSKQDKGATNYPWNVAHIRAYTTSESSDEKSRLENQLICCPNQDGQCPDTATGDTAGFLRFKDKKDFVRCTFKKGIKRTDDAFTSPLRVEIDYGYVQTISTSFYIQKPLKY